MNPDSSPWMSIADAATYLKRSNRFLAKEVKGKRLKAAVIGGRKELFFRSEWLDEWMENQTTPVLLNVRRRG